MVNNGLFNEEEICQTLNKKRIASLSPNLKQLVKGMFGLVNPLKRIKCEKTENYIKPDLIVTYNDIKRYVSVKCGQSSNLHTEYLRTFISFLRECGVSEESLKTIVFIHYGDGTFDGSGETRLDYRELYTIYKKQIDAVNKELNSDIDLIEKIIERIMFRGVDSKAHEAEFLYFGTIEEGVMVSKHQIFKYLEAKPNNWSLYENIHVGPIVIRPHGRYAHTKIKSEKSRNQIQCNWTMLKSDLIYISKHFA